MADPNIATACVPPLWVTTLTAIATPLVAAAAAFVGGLIAYRQWRTAQNRLKLDLFERRHAIYDAALTLLSRIMTSGRVTDTEIVHFVDRTRAAKWLLSDEVLSYFHEDIYKRVTELGSLESELKALESELTGIEARAEGIRCARGTAPRQYR